MQTTLDGWVRDSEVNNIPQDLLDVTKRYRRSFFPWRGQFPPELIEVLLSYYAKKNYVILDPFAGSGITLIEAARKSLECYGAEINPAAIEIARTSHFVNISMEERLQYINEAESIIKDFIDYETEKAFINALRKSSNAYVRNIIICTFMRYITSKKSLMDAFKKHANIIKELPYSSRSCKIFLLRCTNSTIR